MSCDYNITVTVEDAPTITVTTEEPATIIISEVGIKGDRGEDGAPGTSLMLWTSSNW